MLFEMLLILSGSTQTEPDPAANPDANAGVTVTAGTIAPTGCELHVWPAARLNVIGVSLNAVIYNRSVPRSQLRLPTDPLQITVQRDLLTDAGLAARLRLPNHIVVFHDQPLDNVVVRTTSGRLLTPSPDCYAELVVDEIYYQVDMTQNRTLATLFRFRNFGTDATPVRSYGNFVSRGIRNIGRQDSATPIESTAYVAEFRAAFAAGIVEFANRLHQTAARSPADD